MLITGASGLLGSKLSQLATEKGHTVYSAYHQHPPLHGNPVQFDVSDKKAVQKAFEHARPEAVMHAAALTDVDKCETEKELAYHINVKGTENILGSAERCHPFLVYVSTDYVFSGEEGMYQETDHPNPVNHYGITKLQAEKKVRASSLEWCITRPSVIYGSTPAAGKVNFALWLINQLQKGKTVNIITDQCVSPTFNTNLANMILEVIERQLSGIYHLAGATPLNRYEFAHLIAETMELPKHLIQPAKTHEMDWKAKRPRNSSLDVGKALKTLKMKPLEIEVALKTLRKELP